MVPFMSIRPRWRLTRAGFFVLIVASAIFGASFVHRVNLLLLLFAMILSIAVVGVFAGRRQLKQLSVRRVAPPLVPAGRPFSVLLEVSNHDQRRPVLGVNVGDDIRPRWTRVPPPTPLPAIGPGETTRVSYQLNIDRRGVYSFGPVRLLTAYPFGFVRWRWEVPASSAADALLVHPALGELRVEAHRRLGLYELRDARPLTGLLEGSDEFRGLRDFRDGDQPRLIHWRSSARRGVPVVREFDPTTSTQVLMVIHLVEEKTRPIPGQLTESVLSFSATLMKSTLIDPKVRLTMLLIGRHPVLVRDGSGRDQLTRYLRPLAVAELSQDPAVMVEGLRLMAPGEFRDRKVWVLSVGGLSESDRELLQNYAHRRVSTPTVLNASAGDLDALWNPPALPAGPGKHVSSRKGAENTDFSDRAPLSATAPG